MRTVWKVVALCLSLGVSVGVVRYVQGQEPRATRALPISPKVVGVRILLGLLDPEPTAWDGSLAVTSGSVVRLEGWRFRQQDAIVGNSGWRAMTRRQMPGPGQPQRQQRQQARRLGQPGIAQAPAPGQAPNAAPNAAAAPAPGAAPNAPGAAAQPAMTPNGVVAILNVEPQAEVQVTTPKGEFRFKPWELAMGQVQGFLEGAVSVERVPPSFALTSAATEDDFPAAAADRDGSLWVTYVAYRYGQPENAHPTALQEEPKNFDFLRPKGNGDQVRLARLSPSGDGNTWTEVADLTEPGQDVIRPSIAVAGDGSVWVVWSQNVRGNWDLYGRRYRGGTLSKTLRLTSDPGPDLDPALAADRQGNLWLAWQGFRDGNGEIFLTSAAAGSEQWSDPVRVSTSPRNDWDPQVACAGDGSVYVVWDTYDQGNYDVMMRRMAGGRLGELIPVADTARFEARPSIVCDASNRAWVAWEEAPEGWGKDFGFQVTEGVPLYRRHTINLRCYVDGRPAHTAGELFANFPPMGRLTQAAGMPAVAQAQYSFPRLGLDSHGRVFLTFRRTHPELRAPIGTTWLSYVISYEGNAWSAPAPVPDSDALLDGRPALVTSAANGALYMVYSGDGRNHDFGQPVQYKLYVAPVAWDRGAAEAPALAMEASHSALANVPPAPDVASERADIARIRSFRTRAGGRTYQLLRGDYHRHTEISPDGGGDGPLIDMFRYAIDAAGQDWICAGDHDYGNGREYTWWLIQKLDDALNLGPQFVPIFGYERSVVYPNGHRNVMFVQRGIRSLPRLAGNEPGNVSPRDTKMLYNYLRAFDGICSSHTSATNMGTDWRDNDPKLEPVVEIYQGDRQNYEYLGAPRSPSPGNAVGGYEPAGFIWNALAKGYRLGFQSSSDHISTHISFGIAYAERPTREAIVDAFRKRHTYGATDNIVLEVRSGDHLMGDEFETRQPPRLEIRATGTRPIARLVIVRDNNVVYTTEPAKADVNLTWVDNQPHPGAVSYYYVRLEQSDGQLAWASPMWIHYRG